jgi:hypothetical protein
MWLEVTETPEKSITGRIVDGNSLLNRRIRVKASDLRDLDLRKIISNV